MVVLKTSGVRLSHLLRAIPSVREHSKCSCPISIEIHVFDFFHHEHGCRRPELHITAISSNQNHPISPVRLSCMGPDQRLLSSSNYRPPILVENHRHSPSHSAPGSWLLDRCPVPKPSLLLLLHSPRARSRS